MSKNKNYFSWYRQKENKKPVSTGGFPTPRGDEAYQLAVSTGAFGKKHYLWNLGILRRQAGGGNSQ